MLIKNKRMRCNIYEEIKREFFLTWWKSSSWVISHADSEKKKKQIYWDDDKKFEMWNHFEKDATLQKDAFKIICKRCEIVLKHSATRSEINTTKAHLIFKQCVKVVKFEDFSQLILIKNWKKINVKSCFLYEILDILHFDY